MRLFTLLATCCLLFAVFAVAIPAPAFAHENPADDLKPPLHFHGFHLVGQCPPDPEKKLKEPRFAQYDECQTVDVFMMVFINWGNFMIGGAGAFALFFFVVGGFMMMISAGRAEMVQRGKAILIGSVIGLILVFAAQLFVSFFLKTFLEGSTNATAVNNQTELNLEVKVK